MYQPCGIPLLTLLGNVSQRLRDYLQAIADNQDVLQIFSFGVAHKQLSVLPSPKEADWLQNFLEII